MSQIGQARATLDDLYRTPGKAELIGGRIAHYLATGRRPNRVAFRITRSLDDHAARIGREEPYTDNMGFAVPDLPPGRESFCPNSAYYDGPVPPNGMRFIESPPTFAAEVRSENDYCPAAEADMADKRADYFQAGTQVVWDVDPLAGCAHVSRVPDPTQTVTFRRGEFAEAEPAVPGWRVAVDWLFGQPPTAS